MAVKVRINAVQVRWAQGGQEIAYVGHSVVATPIKRATTYEKG